MSWSEQCVTCGERSYHRRVKGHLFKLREPTSEYLCHGDGCEERVSNKGWLCPDHYAEREGEARHAAYKEWAQSLSYPIDGVSQEGLFNAGWDARYGEDV